MSFLVTARKFRPQNFDDVVAQEHIIRTLLNALRMGRIAHAYLFCGPRGVGKTTTARIFAKALNCRNSTEGEPCNACETCREISEGRSIDVIEIDGASNNGVEQVRNIREAVRFVPVRDKYKMYIIDEVHMLSTPAFNALLKTLEEPPEHALFIFATTEVHKLPATVISRCQRFDFRRMELQDIIARLSFIAGKESITVDDDALLLIAKKADGSMRDAQSIFDQVVAFTGSDVTGNRVRDVLHVVDEELYFRLTNLIKERDSRGGFILADEIISSGYDLQEFLDGFEEHLRNILIAKTTAEPRLIEATDLDRKRYAEEAERFLEGDMLRLLGITAETRTAIRHGSQPRLKFEIALVRMIKMDSTVAITDLIARISRGSATESAGGGGSLSGPELPGNGPGDASLRSTSVDQVTLSAYPAAVPANMDAAKQPIPGLVTVDLVTQQWRQFTESIRNFKRTLALTLEDCQPLKMEGDVLQIACGDEFLSSQLQAAAPALAERFHTFFGVPVKYEFVHGPLPRTVESRPSADPQAKSNATRTPPPIVQLLIDEFDAEIIG